jgi:hypothetical protein
VTNAGPGSITDTRVSLTAPDGRTVTPQAPRPVGTVPEGQDSTVSWTVLARYRVSVARPWVVRSFTVGSGASSEVES